MAEAMKSRTRLFWATVPLIYVYLRILWTIRVAPTDCDEVYNYWEPLHFLVRGYGQQTWEWSHEYALRSYAYLLPLKYVAWGFQHAIPRLGITAVPTVSVPLFLGLRSFLAALCAAAELFWLSSLLSYTSRRNVLYTGVILLSSAGMGHAAGAFLPSSTWMIVYMFASGLFLRQSYRAFIVVAVMATLVIGWPFGVVILVPLGLRVLYQAWRRTELTATLAWTLIVAIATQAIVMMIDKSYYGRWVSPSLNILHYNAAAGGDELYGVEPLSYYVKNLLLNLNLAVVGFLVLPTLIFSQRRSWDLVTIILSLYVWTAVTFPRPHKEERFLFPIYPILCLSAVLLVDVVVNLFGRIESALSRHKEVRRRTRHALHLLVWIPTVLISIMRSLALHKYYAAPLELYAAVAQEQGHVCTCGEWYRFPSSFYLQQDIGFLPSSFGGQLPHSFGEMGSLAPSPLPFNNQNREEASHYVTVDDCDWIIDLEDSSCAVDRRELVRSVPLLDADRTSVLHRALYIPILHEQEAARGNVAFKSFALFKVSDNV